MTANDFLSRVRDLLLDTEEPYRTSDAELLRWLSDGQRVIVSVMPEAYSASRAFTLVAGQYRQTLPSDMLRLLDVPCNLGPSGTTRGQVIRLIGRKVLDGVRPNWMSEQGDVVEHYIYDFKTPRVFLIFPTPSSPVSVELVGSVTPPDVISASASLALDDNYASILLDYVAFRAFSKDIDSATSSAKAASYYSMFSGGLSALVGGTAERVPASQKGGTTE